MPFELGDMRDHIVSHKNDHGASYGRYAVLQRWGRLKISFCEIFGVVQFSTFATQSSRKPTSWRSRRVSAEGPGRVETFLYPNDCKQPGVMDLDATG